VEDLVAIMEALGARLDQLHLTLHASHPQGDQVREAKELAIKGIVLARQIQSANIRRDQALALLTWHAGSKSGAIGGR
jgi:hypothetical protein